MLIVASIYIVLAWLVFSRFKLLAWTWKSGSIVVAFGVVLLLAVVGLLHHFTPVGTVSVQSKVVEIASLVGGRVVAVDVTPNKLIKRGEPLFQIDPFLFQAKANELEAVLAGAEQNVRILGADVELARADIAAIKAQLNYAEQRRKDLEALADRGASTKFKLQDVNAEVDLLTAQLAAAQAREKRARLALASNIDGEQTEVARIRAQLDAALFDLDQTTVVAPSDGYVTLLELAVGDQARPLRPVMAFIEVASMQISGIFPQSGFRTIAPGTRVVLAFSSNPGKLYETQVLDVAYGIGQGQIAASGTLPKIGSVGFATQFPVKIAIPDGVPQHVLRLGMSGTATAFADDAGPIEMLAMILLWLRAWALYL